MNRLLLVFVLLFVSITSCQKSTVDPNTDFFPAKQVSTSVDLHLPQYFDLNNPQGFVYINAGYRGIILYHTTDDKFVAYDRTCPYQTDKSCAYVTVDSSRIFFRCGHYDTTWNACCNSKFDPASGMPYTLPAQRALKQYYTSKRDNIIEINSSPF